MPGRRKYRKRPYRRRRRKRKAHIPYGLVTPNSYTCRLKYRDDWKLIPTTADIPYKSFWSATSLYDPDVSGSGHQPKQFDQLSLYYQHYTVLSAKITIRPYDPYSGSMLMFVIPTSTSLPSNLTTITEILEANRCQYRMIGTSFENTKPIVSTYSKKKTFGNTQNEDLTAATSADPVEQKYWCVGAINGSAGNTPTTIPIIVEVEYIALFTERKNVAES